MRARFRAGFAGCIGLDVSVLGEPGITVVGTAYRAGSSAVACYWIGRRTVLWCDPAVVDLLDPVEQAAAGHAGALSADVLAPLMSTAGFELIERADMRLLTGVPAVPAVPAGYHQRWLSATDPAHVELVRTFTARSDPTDVEEAALDDLEDFAESAIDVLVDDGADGSHVVAYASGAEWPWDPLLADVGVLVDAAHRGRGLARVVVAGCADALLRDGRVPLYRHDCANLASAAVARSIGFEPVTTLAFYRLPGRTS